MDREDIIKGLKALEAYTIPRHWVVINDAALVLHGVRDSAEGIEVYMSDAETFQMLFEAATFKHQVLAPYARNTMSPVPIIGYRKISINDNLSIVDGGFRSNVPKFYPDIPDRNPWVISSTEGFQVQSIESLLIEAALRNDLYSAGYIEDIRLHSCKKYENDPATICVL